MTNLQKLGLKTGLATLATAIALLPACGGGSSGSSSSNTTSSSGTTSQAGPLVFNTEVTGWASQGNGTTGGKDAASTNIYVVHNRAELKAALANSNSATYATSTSAAKIEPKTIYVVGSIYGTDLGNGKFADEAYYKTLTSTYKSIGDWDFESYIGYVTAQASGGTATTEQTAAASARTMMQAAQKAQIEFSVPSNTTIIGVGADAKIIDSVLSINAQSNIIIRNIEFQAPIDLAPAYDWGAGDEEWNAKFKPLNVVTGKQLWVDHCTFSDGAHEDTEIRTINGVTLPVMRHDGLLDIEDSSDYITVSYNIFKNHDKTNMVGGSGDDKHAKEYNYNRLTFNNNIWQDSVQRAPRARFGQIHVYNNYYTGNTDNSIYPASYYIGMGAESRILSEGNAFYMTGSKASVSRVISNLNGYQFKDVGSWYNGVSASTELEAAAKAALEARWNSAQSAATSKGFTLGAYTNDLGWSPSYSYTRGASAEAVRDHALAYAGVGKLFITEGTSARPLLSDSQGATYTIANALAGSDSWAPQSVNSTMPQAGRLYPAGFTANYVVAKDGTGSYTTIQAALNAASTSTAERVYIQVKAGDYNEQLIVGNTTSAVTLYSTESDATKVRIHNALSKGSAQTAYSTFVGSTYDASVYSGNSDAKTVYNLCMASGKASAIGTECSATMRVRNNGFQLVNITVENAWVETGTNDQANAIMIDKADKVVLDGVRLLGNQDTLYLSNAGKRVFVTGSDIYGDVDFIYGSGIGVFQGSTIHTIGTRKASGTSITAPSTTASTQTFGLLFNDCVFLADSSTTANSIYLARQWNDSDTDVPGKTIVRNSFLGGHVATSSGPWSPTMITGGVSTALTYNNLPMLAEYQNWQETSWLPAGVTPTPSPSPSPTSAPTSTPTPTPTAQPLTTPAAISGSTVLVNSVHVGSVNTTTSVSYNGTSNAYTMTSAGLMKKGATTDSMDYAYSTITGDFTFVARMTSLYDSTNSNETTTCSGQFECRAGIMIRNGLDPAARYFGLAMRGNAKLQWEQRATDGGSISTSTLSPTYSSLPSTSAPLWFKLNRTGQVITVAWSTDGTTWQGTKTMDFSAADHAAFDNSVYFGLMGLSGSVSATITSAFDSVTITK